MSDVFCCICYDTNLNLTDCRHNVCIKCFKQFTCKCVKCPICKSTISLNMCNPRKVLVYNNQGAKYVYIDNIMSFIFSKSYKAYLKRVLLQKMKLKSVYFAFTKNIYN